jgi:quinoprotein dehydrogenase-associated probable ABC transporter substrate-binding protein
MAGLVPAIRPPTVCAPSENAVTPRWGQRRGRAWHLVAVLGLLLIHRAMAQAPGLGESAELVDPKVFRVCADPHNLPFSDEQGQGFENKLAELFARKLNEPTSYTYLPQVIGFVRNTLNALRCDVIIGTAASDPMVQTTNPYYRTTYALIFKPDTGLDDIQSLEDPRLKDKRIGIVAGTPPATILARNGLMADAKPYPLTVDTRTTSSPQMMTDDLTAGRIDAGVLWGPMAGYFAQHTTPHLTVVPLLKEGGQMDFRIAMGVRRTDQDWKRKLNRLIASSQPEIDKILTDYGVPLLDEQGQLRAP